MTGPRLVDTASVEAFQREGAVVLRDVIGADWLQLLDGIMPELVEDAQESMAKRSPETPPSYSRVGMWRSSEPFARFLFRSPVGGLAAEHMGSAVARLYEDLLIYKVTGGDGTTPWHRDAPFWPLAGRQLCTVWLSLESVGKGAGALRFIAGSHDDSDELVKTRGLFADASDTADRPVITIEADPGDVVIFNPRALHTVESAVSERPRRTITLRFVGDDIRWRPLSANFHEWMADCGLAAGDPLEHPWFPVVGSTR